jgi:hypothetical protein
MSVLVQDQLHEVAMRTTAKYVIIRFDFHRRVRKSSERQNRERKRIQRFFERMGNLVRKGPEALDSSVVWTDFAAIWSEDREKS